MAKSYYTIRDSATGLFFGGLAEHRQNATDIVDSECFLIMSKRALGKKNGSIEQLEKYLRGIFYNRRKPTLQIPKFPETFEVVYVVPASGSIKRSITPVTFALCDFAKNHTHGLAFSSLMKKIAEREETDFKYALVISGNSFWQSDIANIKDGMALVVGNTIRSTLYGQTAIAFKTENDAVAFRLRYSGKYIVKMVALAE